MEMGDKTMAFERLTYTKSWKNPRDFPTYEPDEGTVRADLQQLHDEARDGINRLVDALNGASAASLLPISAVEGLAAQTVQEAIEEVFAAVISAAAAKIVNGSVSREKLEQTLLERIYGGRVWASMGAPTPADNPNTDFPVGQLWLRPAMTLENLTSDAWTVDGGTVEETDGGWLFTTDGSQDYVKAVQTAVSGGVPGQQVLIRLALGALSEHFEEVSLYLNGMETELEEAESMRRSWMPQADWKSSFWDSCTMPKRALTWRSQGLLQSIMMR